VKGALILISALLLTAIVILALLHFHSKRESAGPVVHVENGFEFTAHGPYKIVAPLFGASAERVWAKDHWNPKFLYPSPERDTFGEVFTVAHSHLKSVWVNTALASSTDRYSSSGEGSFSYRCKGRLPAHRAKSQLQRACDQVRKR
jgi:hypothetical protein